MSEEETPIEKVKNPCQTFYLHGSSGDVNRYYLKSEADKYIALLKDKANYNEYAYKHKSEELADTCRFYENELRHHKYKRCLAMARIAQDDWHLHNSFYAMGHQEFEKRKCEFYEKWRNRWFKIAEKFKDKEAT